MPPLWQEGARCGEDDEVAPQQLSLPEEACSVLDWRVRLLPHTAQNTPPPARCAPSNAVIMCAAYERKRDRLRAVCTVHCDSRASVSLPVGCLCFGVASRVRNFATVLQSPQCANKQS